MTLFTPGSAFNSNKNELFVVELLGIKNNQNNYTSLSNLQFINKPIYKIYKNKLYYNILLLN